MGRLKVKKIYMNIHFQSYSDGAFFSAKFAERQSSQATEQALYADPAKQSQFESDHHLALKLAREQEQSSTTSPTAPQSSPVSPPTDTTWAQENETCSAIVADPPRSSSLDIISTVVVSASTVSDEALARKFQEEEDRHYAEMLEKAGQSIASPLSACADSASGEVTFVYARKTGFSRTKLLRAHFPRRCRRCQWLV